MQNNLKKGLFLSLLGWVGLNGVAQTVVTTMVEYLPAPGQFVNTSIGGPGAAENLASTGNGFLTLGAFGGYLVLRFENPVENDPLNPYGIDFTLFGNATPSSSEPAAVWVMTDSNQNLLPDETWHLLAGSDYWFSTSVHQYQISYSNPGGSAGANIPWTDNLENSGFIYANEFHKQPYYPIIDSFPQINQTKYTLTGEFINVRIDTSDPMLIVTKHYPFGYADNTPKNFNANSNLPDNPYTPELEGWGGDSFDISWAVDENGNYVNLEKIDFIKIQNAVNFNFGRIGEISTEITSIADVTPASVEVTDTLLLTIEPLKGKLLVNNPFQLHSYLFSWGRLIKNAEIDWTIEPENSVIIDDQGIITANQPGDLAVYACLNSNHTICDSLILHIEEEVGIKQVSIQEIKFWPNPVKSSIKLTYYNDLMHYTILTIDGKTVLEGMVHAAHPIQVSDLHDGLYIMVLTGKQQRNCITFIKD